VSRSGSSYICILASTGNDPVTDTIHWSIIAQIGATGPTGPQGIQGPAGPTPPLADATQNGLLRQVSGAATDFVDGTNHSQPLSNIISTDAGNALIVGTDNRIKAGGPTSHYYDYDDFIGNVGGVAPTQSKLFRIDSSGAAGSVAQAYIADLGDGHHGVVQLSGGAVTNNWARAYMGGGFFLRNSTFTFRAILNPFNAGGTAAAQHIFGFSNAPAGIIATTQYYIIFYVVHAVLHNWQYLVRSLTNATSFDTGILASANTWFDLKIVANATSVKFYINGVQVGSTVTTNIPVGQVLYPAIWHNSSGDTTPTYLMVDWAEIDIDTGIAGRYSKSPI
jgi:hypothetical protein